jgi:hypothetical protein
VCSKSQLRPSAACNGAFATNTPCDACLKSTVIPQRLVVFATHAYMVRPGGHNSAGALYPAIAIVACWRSAVAVWVERHRTRTWAGRRRRRRCCRRHHHRAACRRPQWKVASAPVWPPPFLPPPPRAPSSAWSTTRLDRTPYGLARGSAGGFVRRRRSAPLNRRELPPRRQPPAPAVTRRPAWREAPPLAARPSPPACLAFAESWATNCLLHISHSPHIHNSSLRSTAADFEPYPYVRVVLD